MNLELRLIFIYKQQIKLMIRQWKRQGIIDWNYGVKLSMETVVTNAGGVTAMKGTMICNDATNNNVIL